MGKTQQVTFDVETFSPSDVIRSSLIPAFPFSKLMGQIWAISYYAKTLDAPHAVQPPAPPGV